MSAPKSQKKVTFADLTEKVPFFEVPYIDKLDFPTLELDWNMQEWWKDGVVHLPNILPDPLIHEYLKVRNKVKSPNGWESNTPYMKHPEILELGLYAPVIDEMESVIGDKMGMHLNLTGHISTERGWHQDEYLNPPFINSWYCAAWFALEDIHPDSGPFQYVPGSHKWGIMRMEKTLSFLDEKERTDPNWPRLAERFVNDACQEEIDRRNAEIVTYLPKKGDVLLWHPRLMHRGSEPKDKTKSRKAFIAHYSALSVRRDMAFKAHFNGKHYFVF